MSQSISCPNCHFDIEVSDALSTQLREQVRKEFEIEIRRKENLMGIQESQLRQRETTLQESQQSLETQISARVETQLTFLREQAEFKAQEKVTLEFQDLETQLAETKEKLAGAQRTELELRKNRRELEAQKAELELDVNGRLDEERAKICEAAETKIVEKNRLRDADRDKLISDLRRQIDDLKRKSEQGSQQAQGEVMEVELESLLRQHFPIDTVDAIPVGSHGGDVLQVVHDNNGQDCGAILWESKRTKAWNDNWLPKLRDNQRAAGAHVAVLATVELPKGITTFAYVDDVWITSRACMLGLAAALRLGLIEVARTRTSLEGRQTKIELLYRFLTGPEFRQRVEGIAEAFATMRDDLESEKRSLHRIWAKREKQLERAMLNTSGLHGDLGGILGNSLPQIANLEIAQIAVDCETAEREKAPWD